MKYRRFSAVVDAQQFINNNQPDNAQMNALVEWVNEGKAPFESCAFHNGTDIFIPTDRGELRVFIFDWIVRDDRGDFHVVKPGSFSVDYKEV